MSNNKKSQSDADKLIHYFNSMSFIDLVFDLIAAIVGIDRKKYKR